MTQLIFALVLAPRIGIGILYLFDRQLGLHDIGEIISKCEIILPGDSHKGTN